MKQIPKWKIALRIISALLYVIAFATATFCALRSVGAMAVILLMLGANAFLAVFCGVTASIALEEERYYYEMQNARLAMLLNDRQLVRIENELRKAEQLRKGSAPCEFYEYVDEVAEFCDKDHKDDECNPDECWVKVKKYIAERDGNDENRY